MKAVIFARVSSREQEQGHSIDAQVAKLKDYCFRNNFRIVKEYVVTESSTKGERKRFYEAIEYIKSQKEQIALVADAVDRIQRSFVESITLDELMRQEKLEIHFIRENMILNNNARSADIMRWDFSVMSAKSYIYSMKENVARSIDYKLKQGEITGKAPLGYLNAKAPITGKSTVIFDPERAFLVKSLFDDYSTGSYSMGDLTEKAKKMGLQNKDSNKPLAKSQIDHLLKNPFYYGAMKVKGVLFPHKYSPLISKTLFDRCREVTASWNKKPFKYSAKDFIFRGLIKCADCGCTISTDRKKDKYNYLSCSKYWGKCSAERVREELILNQVAQVFKSISIPADTLQTIKDTLNRTNQAKVEFQKQAITALRRQYDDIGKKLSTLLELCIDQSITKNEYDQKAQELKERQYQIKTKIEAHDKADEQFTITVTTLLDLASRAHELFISSKVEQKRQLIDLVLSNLQLKGKSLVYSIRKPFDLFVEPGFCSSWLGD